MKLTASRGMQLLGVWLTLTGLIPLLHISFAGLSTVMAVVAIVAGLLILVSR